MVSSTEGELIVMGQNKAQRQAAARAKQEAMDVAVEQPQVEQAKVEQKLAQQPTVTPATLAKPEAVSKQQLSIMKLTIALREQRQVEVKPEMLKQDGKFILLLIGKEWPVIRIGASGGIEVGPLTHPPVIKSYQNAFQAAVDGDKLLAKQNAREQKRAQATAPAE